MITYLIGALIVSILVFFAIRRDLKTNRFDTPDFFFYYLCIALSWIFLSIILLIIFDYYIRNYEEIKKLLLKKIF